MNGALPGEVIVKLRSGVSAQNITGLPAVGASLHLRESLGLPGLGLYRAESTGTAALSIQGGEQLLRALAASPQVAPAEPNRQVHAFKTPNDTWPPLQWDALAMNLPAAWAITAGKAATVGGVDTDITAHPDLKGKLLPGYDFVSDLQNAGPPECWRRRG